MTADMSKHPALLHLGKHPVWSDEYRNAQAMLETYESQWDDLAELSPGDADAYGLLKDQADRLACIVQHCGSVHGWTLSQHGRLHAEACRLLPAGHEFNRANWSE